MYSGINVKIPDNNIIERQYIINYIFYDFLGIEVKIIIDKNIQDYEITFANRKLIFQDAFFNLFTSNFDYLNIKYFPSVICTKNQFLIEDDIPVLYGNSFLEISENKIVCGIDIFASSFFMLTRWEEYVNIIRDDYGRFPGSESVACNNNFLHRPVVNEYIEMLWNMLLYLGYKGLRKERKFDLILSHDVDLVFRPFYPLRTMMGDVIKRGKIGLAFSRIPAFFCNYVDTFDFLMNVSERVGVKSRFYFMAADKKRDHHDTPYYLNSNKFRRIIEQIKERGHVIGFHPGFRTFTNEKEWEKEKELLEKSLGQKVTEGRQHCLRVDIPKTLLIWDSQQMLLDSSLGYADLDGFRCGTGDIFPVFDFINRKQLALKERPLILMDVSLKNYRTLSNEQVKDVLARYIKLGKKYKMTTTWLFHNSSFDIWDWKGWKKVYEETITKYI